MVTLGVPPTPPAFPTAVIRSPTRTVEERPSGAVVSPEAFLEGFDPSYLTQLQVPPGEWKGPEAREELRTKYAELVAFFQQAAERREGILIVFV